MCVAPKEKLNELASEERPMKLIEEELFQGVADGVMADVAKLGGDGGVILVTPEGHAIFSFNTSGMYRGRATSAGVNEVAIFGGEDTASVTPDH
jgi:beta-aspartyl-peptidase (threonine type)